MTFYDWGDPLMEPVKLMAEVPFLDCSLIEKMQRLYELDRFGAYVSSEIVAFYLSIDFNSSSGLALDLKMYYNDIYKKTN